MQIFFLLNISEHTDPPISEQVDPPISEQADLPKRGDKMHEKGLICCKKTNAIFAT